MKKLFLKTNNPNLVKEAKLMDVELIDEVSPFININTKKDEEKAVVFSQKHEFIFVSCSDWKIIPLENLIAKCRRNIVAVVDNFKDAKLALEIMELGVDGILLKTDSLSELKKVVEIISKNSHMLKLQEAEITEIKNLGLGARSCIDTCSMMKDGEGMLIGSSSSGLILVQAEVKINELAVPRPFRVNAGAVSMYTLAPNNKTVYIEEIKAGSEVLLIDRDGKTQNSIVGRNKIEIRPLILITAQSNLNKATVVLQNAETIRLVTKTGSKSVTELKIGDKLLCFFEKGGRHFGSLIKDETIIEQ